MVKTTVYLDENSMSALRSMAQRKGTTQAELIRNAVRKLVAGNPPPLPKGMGMFSSGYTDTSSRRKEILMAAARKGRWR